ncbi:hypothetical protein LCGC14_0545870 [marine sediment metagenome]|uniref:Uncharacterized protein n=1 Tax=marine sediment metagenome TaxID=412755 RepID=A0A0F9S9S4_9ZZZZ
MNFTKALIPKDTEEIKPDLFIQKTSRGYRQVSPAAWDGKIIWKNFLFGQGFLKSLIFFAIILFLAWSYFHDVKVYQDFYEEVISDPVLFCLNVSLESYEKYEDTNIIQGDYERFGQ